MGFPTMAKGRGPTPTICQVRGFVLLLLKNE